jgi:hypothetical protein
VSWGKIDDHLDDDERFWNLDLRAAGLYLLCAPYCLRSDSPKVSRALAERMGGRSAGSAAQILVGRDIWQADGDGWVYSPGSWETLSIPADKSEAVRLKRAQAGRIGGQRSVELRLETFGDARLRRKDGSAVIPGFSQESDASPLSKSGDSEVGASNHSLSPLSTTNPEPEPEPEPERTNGTLRGNAREAESHRADETTTAVDNSPLICPDCGKGNLRDRTNQQDGHAYIGCDRYPACRWTDKVHRRVVDRRRALSPPEPERLPDDPATVARLAAMSSGLADGMKL